MKKGFTLVELLGVLAILAILAVITVPLIQGLIEDGLDDSKKIQEDSFEKAARSWAGSNAFSLPEEGEYKEVTLGQLVDGGFLETNSDGNIMVSGSDEEYDLAKDCVIITKGKKSYKYKFKRGC